MKRPDLKILQLTKKRLDPLGKVISKNYFDRVLSSPLLWFGDKDFDTLKDEWDVPDVPLVTDKQEWSFDEFVIVYKIETEDQLGNMVCPTHMWAYVCTHPDKFTLEQKRALGMREMPVEQEVSEVEDLYKKLADTLPHRFSAGDNIDWPEDSAAYVHVQLFNEEDSSCTAFGGYFFFTDDPTPVHCFVPTVGCMCALLESYKDDIEGFDTHHRATKAFASEVMSLCMKLMTYMKYGDKHAVEKFPAKAKKKAVGPLAEKRPWINASGPHILLLDRLPSTQKPHQGGTHASPKPHRRRGHWKTLNHPRYRRHPQYQKKIFVKPSFVGPRQVTYEGNVYRLVDPIEERL